MSRFSPKALVESTTQVPHNIGQQIFLHTTTTGVLVALTSTSLTLQEAIATAQLL